MQATLGRIIHCWPHDVEVPEGEIRQYAAIVTDVIPRDEKDPNDTTGKIVVHYWRTKPDGEVVAHFANDPADGVERGRWWWPPRAS